MLERNFGDNTLYTLTVDEMAGVYDMLEESHFPKAVTYTFLVEWFRSVGFHGTADKMLDTLNGDDNLEGIMSAAEYQKLFKEAEALIHKEEGENDES